MTQPDSILRCAWGRAPQRPARGVRAIRGPSRSKSSQLGASQKKRQSLKDTTNTMSSLSFSFTSRGSDTPLRRRRPDPETDPTSDLPPVLRHFHGSPVRPILSPVAILIVGAFELRALFTRDHPKDRHETIVSRLVVQTAQRTVD